MSYYAQQSDVENVYGTENVARWSQLDNDVAIADTNRIATALTWADAQVNNFFRGGPYTVPLPVNTTTTYWAAVLAGAWLFKSRPIGEDNPVDWVKDKEKEVRGEMSKFKAGIFRLDTDATQTANLPQAPAPVIV